MSEALIDEENFVPPTARVGLPIVRTHHRFLLRHRHFVHQYAAMYRARLEALERRVLKAVSAKVAAGNVVGTFPQRSRVLELGIGERALCVGVAYKEARLLPRFLDEYQKELVRIDAGEEEDSYGGSEAVSCSVPLRANSRGINPTPGTCCEGDARNQSHLFNICGEDDEVFMEDDSGRVRLEGIPAAVVCTGLVLGVDGTLLENGCLSVNCYAIGDLREVYVPRTLPTVSSPMPCYVGFVCGLELCSAQTQTDAATNGRAMIELLVDYLSGALGSTGKVVQPSYISRLVIGGNSIAPTDELRLKRKVKLDPSDHVKLSDDKQNNGTVTSASLMRELDAILARLADSIEVELMPGDNDMTNAFHPQQPIHPLLLPEAARRSSIGFVTNPYEFVAFPSDDEENHVERSGADATEGGTIFFVSSGSNLNCVNRETRFDSRLDAMSLILQSGCACPTAPNTVFSYPFTDTDPFVFPKAPHCFVCCDQPEWETRWEPLATFDPTRDTNGCGILLNEEMEGQSQEIESDGAGVRLVCVPTFAQTGKLVLVDVNSPTLETTYVDFASGLRNPR